MKGITSIIAVILLLLITIAIAGAVFIFFVRTTEVSTSGTEQELETQVHAIQIRYVIEGVSQNHVYIRNLGVVSLTGLRLYVNNIPVNFDGPSSLGTGQLGTYNISIADLSGITNPSTVKVTSQGIEQEINAAPSLPDTTPPLRFNATPSGVLPAGTTSTTISITTDESATCKYETISGVTYALMSNTFTTTGTTSHSSLVGGLLNGNNYTFYVRCQDAQSNANTNDSTIAFGVDNGPLEIAQVQMNRINITNTGLVALSGFNFYVNGIQINHSGPSSLSAGTSAIYLLNETQLLMHSEPAQLFVTTPSANDTMQTNFYTNYALGYWKFDEQDISSTAVDSSPFGYNGTTVSGANFTPGRYGNASNFDGSDDYIVMSTSEGLNVGNYTISVWVLTRNISSPNLKTILAKDLDGYANGGFSMNTISQNIRFSIRNINTATTTTSPLTNNTWYHVIVTFNQSLGGNGALRIFVNGTVGYSSTGISGPGTRNTDVYIGKDGTNPAGAPFNGMVDDLKILNYSIR